MDNTSQKLQEKEGLVEELLEITAAIQGILETMVFHNPLPEDDNSWEDTISDSSYIDESSNDNHTSEEEVSRDASTDEMDSKI